MDLRKSLRKSDEVATFLGAAGIRPSLPSAFPRARTEPPFPYLRWLGSQTRRGGCGRAAPPSFFCSAASAASSPDADDRDLPRDTFHSVSGCVERNDFPNSGHNVPSVSGARRGERTPGRADHPAGANPPRPRPAPPTRSPGSGEDTSTAAPGDRVRERQPARVQELALQAEPPGVPYCRSPAHRMADRRHVHADLMGAAGLERHPQQRRRRAAAARSRSASAPRAASSVSIDISTRSRRWRPIGASIVPVRAAGCPSTSARYSRCSSAPRDQRLQRAVDVVALGHDEQPRGVAVEPVDDPRAPRLLAAGARPPSACASVPVAVPARGVDDHAGGLVDHQQVLVLVGHRERRRGGAAATGGRRSASIYDPLAGATPRGAWGAARPSTRTWLGVDQRLRSAREPSGSARNRSSRVPAASSADVELDLGGSPPLSITPPRPRARTAGPHPERDRHVGDVERRPVRQLDEVGHGAVGDAVDQVAERAADQQPRRQPQPRPVGRRAK